MPLVIEVRDFKTKRWELAGQLGAGGLWRSSISSYAPNGRPERYEFSCIDDSRSTIRRSAGDSEDESAPELLKELKRGGGPFRITVMLERNGRPQELRITHR